MSWRYVDSCPFYIWDVFEGSTKVILLIADDGTNDPESVAAAIASGLQSSTGGSLNLTFVASSICVGAECMDVLKDGQGDIPETKCRLICRIREFFKRFFGKK